MSDKSILINPQPLLPKGSTRRSTRRAASHGVTLFKFHDLGGGECTPFFHFDVGPSYAVMTFALGRCGQETETLLALIEYMETQGFEIQSHAIIRGKLIPGWEEHDQHHQHASVIFRKKK